MRSGFKFSMAVALTLLIVAATLWVYPSSTDFAPANPYWNGLADASGRFRITTVSSLRALPAQGGGTVLIVIPYVLLPSGDLDTVAKYVESGGVLVLMDDFGFGNDVLARLGLRARLAGQILVDPLFNHKSRRFPRISEFLGPVSSGVESIVLNHATVIRVTGGMTVVARSSPVSFLDVNGSGRRDPDEPGGPFAVAALARVGAGYVVLVSDPSIILNSMLDLAQNRRFLQNVFRLAGDNARIYLDGAHLPHAPLDVVKDRLAGARDLLDTPLTTFVAVGTALAVPLAALARSRGR